MKRMSRLILFELEKIVKRKIVWVGLAVLLLLNVALYMTVGMPSMTVMSDDGGYIRGADAIAADKQIAAEYEGVVTDSVVDRLLSDHRVKQEKTEIYAYMDYAYDNLGRYFMDENGRYSGLPVTAVFGEDPQMREFHYGRGGEDLLTYLPLIFLVMGYVLIIALTPVFSDEYARRTDALILTSRLGKRQCALSKAAASLLFSAVLALAVIAVNYVLVAAFYGTEGWNMSIQLCGAGDYTAVPYVMTLGETLIWAVVFFLSAMIGLTGLILICSAFSSSSFVALIVVLVIYTVPLFLTQLAYEPLQYALSFMPIIMTTVVQVLAKPLLELGSLSVNFACLPVLTMLLLAASSFFLCVKAFRRTAEVRG